MTSYVSGNFFDGLGLKPAAGRLILRSEGEVPGQDPVVVLDYGYWKDKFNGDLSVVGRPACEASGRHSMTSTIVAK